MRKIVYWVLFVLGIALMLFYSVVTILKAYTDISFNSWFFESARLRLIIASVYTIAIIMLRSQIMNKR